MTSPFHRGEQQVQKRAGVRAQSERVGRIIGATIPAAAQEFLLAQPLLILGGADAHNRVWASLVTGESGFARAEDDRTLRVESLPAEGDPLREALENGEIPLGVLAIEAATRRRMRLNGQARAQDGALVIHARQVYSNCPKYIQKRVWHRVAHKARLVAHSDELSDAQQQTVEKSDTFFIASLAPQGADASHRGGAPGFVRAEKTRLLFPDYAGNSMFNTLGNLQIDARAGLLFLGDNGDTLGLSGRALVHWQPELCAQFAGAERVVEFRIERVVAIAGASPLRWEWLEASPFNPST